jgi:geranyl-CoA carboxylase alpha subunit
LAIAATLLYQASASASAHQGGLAGWRSAGNAPWRLVLRQGEQKHDVELAVQEAGQQPRLLARVGETEIAIRLLRADGRWAVVELDGIRRRVAYHQQAQQLWLFGQNGDLELQDVTHEPAGGQGSAGSGTVKAPMDGAIVEVLVSEGERVGKGQLLVVLEAMKMEHPLKAGVDGVIRRIQVTRGDQVKSRQLLVEVEEA